MFLLVLRSAFRASLGKKDWYNRHIGDQFVKKAQMMNFRSRASFKLLQIQEKYKVLDMSKPILDLGAAPGSWTQAVLYLNPKASVAAVDLLPIKEIEGIDFYQTDARSPILHKILAEKYGNFGTIISDMAPNFSGTLFQTHIQSIQLNKLCLSLSISMGSQNCSLVMKTIEGEYEKRIVFLLEHFYSEVIRYKPKSSRKESAQHFIVCKGLKDKQLDRKTTAQKLQQLDLTRLKSKKQIFSLFSE